MAGAVYVRGQKVLKPDRRIDEEEAITVRDRSTEYVGFGGVKLAHALSTFGLDVEGKVALDIGSSTGGFVDCLLRRGVARIYAVDVGTHQLHERLRRDTRVILAENVNARYLTAGDIGEKVDLATIDVSFISLKKVLPAAMALVKPHGLLLTLVKPQFEVGRYHVGKGGIVKSEERIEEVLEDIRTFGGELGLRAVETTEAPREREKKNREFFILWER